jgi:hypothetical protein
LVCDATFVVSELAGKRDVSDENNFSAVVRSIASPNCQNASATRTAPCHRALSAKPLDGNSRDMSSYAPTKARIRVSTDDSASSVRARWRS